MSTGKRRIARIPDDSRRIASTAKGHRGADSSRNKCKCKWMISAKTNTACSEIFPTTDRLFQHVTTQHVSCGPKGYSCKWAQCGIRTVFTCINEEELQKHIRSHIFSSSAKDHRSSDSNQRVSDEATDDESSEDCTDDGDDDYDFAADANARKAKRLMNKRKNNVVDANRSKIRKASDNSSTGKTFHSGPKSNITSDKPNTTTIKLADTSSFFYKFTCEWYASAAQYGVDSAMSKPIKCKRKFSRLNEAIEHLQTHHIRKLVSNDEPFRCAWQDCDSGEFSDEESIKEHVMYHARGDNTPLIQNGKGTATESGGKSIKKDSGVTWYTAALHSLLSCDISLPTVDPCNNNTCYFCRYSSLQSSVEKLGSTSSTILSEFRDLLPKFEGYKDNPYKFISNLVALAAVHEETHHKSAILQDLFWVEDINDSDYKCQKHFDKDLASFFSALYKKCNVCSRNSKSWPTAEMRYVIFGWDASNSKTISPVIYVKGREYQLKSVLGRDSKTGTFYSGTCNHGNEWTMFRGDVLKATECDKVLKLKGACMAIYAASYEPLMPITADIPESTGIPSDNIDSRPPSPAPRPLSPPAHPVCPEPDVLQQEWTAGNNMKTGQEYSPVNFPPVPCIIPKSAVEFSICCRRGGDFDAILSQRKLKNMNGVGSCINAVIQALLTTGLSVIVTKLCELDIGCFLCRLLSVSQHIFTSKGKITEPIELELGRTVLGAPEKAEGNPVECIKRLAQRMASDEQTKHRSNDAKYKMMIRFQRNCPCRESYEALHWTVNPSKQHESLNDLMAQHSLYCEKCNSVNLTEAVQLPEILIITVESDGRDYSLHYPDEMPTRSSRYFLSAVIVSDDNGSHFSTYGRVFGKWLLYNDSNEARKFSSGDVLHLQTNVRVLLYVTKELTPNDVRLSLAKAKELKDSVKHKPIVTVKEERHQ